MLCFFCPPDVFFLSAVRAYNHVACGTVTLMIFKDLGRRGVFTAVGEYKKPNSPAGGGERPPVIG